MTLKRAVQVAKSFDLTVKEQEIPDLVGHLAEQARGYRDRAGTEQRYRYQAESVVLSFWRKWSRTAARLEHVQYRLSKRSLQLRVRRRMMKTAERHAKADLAEAQGYARDVLERVNRRARVRVAVMGVTGVLSGLVFEHLWGFLG